MKAEMRWATSAAFLGLALSGCPSTAAPTDGGEPCGDGGCAFVPLDLDRSSSVGVEELVQASSPCHEPVRVNVVGVIDGDTVHVTGIEYPPGFDPGGDGGVDIGPKVRFIGVNSPEVSHAAGEPNDCFGQYATIFTQQLLYRSVWLTFDEGCVDNNDRWLAYVHVGPGEEGLWQRYLLRGGYARTLTIPPNSYFAETFAADEEDARNARRGLWAVCEQ